jgi:hypothetical protein
VIAVMRCRRVSPGLRLVNSGELRRRCLAVAP